MAPHPTSNPDVALNLTLAVIASSTTPLLLLNGDLILVAASNSFCQDFGIDSATVEGKPLNQLGAGEWNTPSLNSLLEVIAAGRAEIQNYEFDLRRAGKLDRSLVMSAQKLEYGNEENVRLLISVLDVTDARLAARAKDDLIREKAVLLQEVQHRVANSLQIIAGVLMQSARKVQSEEVRTHLHQAHQRVMSVASLQRQLAASQVGDVALRPYLTTLCESIGASMIRDPDQLSLVVTVDDTVTNANISTSLGLIVTELVINALKHAFPGDRSGKIKVEYHSNSQNWTLSVTDNGVGMPSGAVGVKPGLGTSIVQALSAQLQGVIKVCDVHPGTAIYITHTQLAVVANDAMPVDQAV